LASETCLLRKDPHQTQSQNPDSVLLRCLSFTPCLCDGRNNTYHFLFRECGPSQNSVPSLRTLETFCRRLDAPDILRRAVLNSSKQGDSMVSEFSNSCSLARMQSMLVVIQNLRFPIDITDWPTH
jgi:hypothetical protein